MLITRKYFVRIGDVFFDVGPHGNTIDILRCTQAARPFEGAECQEFYTLVVDLTHDETELFASFKKDTRTEIRRAEQKDRIVCTLDQRPDPAGVAAAADYYDGFASLKRLPAVNRRELHAYAEASELAMSEARQHGELLVSHLYYLGKARARLLHSASYHQTEPDHARRALIGRANRYLHWHDMLAFRAARIPAYDFGSWYPGTSDEARLRINRFKEEFGGRLVKDYNYVRAITWKGRLALWIRHALRSSGSSRRPPS